MSSEATIVEAFVEAEADAPAVMLSLSSLVVKLSWFLFGVAVEVDATVVGVLALVEMSVSGLELCAVVFFSFFGVEIEGDPDDTVAFFCSW